MILAQVRQNQSQKSEGRRQKAEGGSKAVGGVVSSFMLP
jgi:hypothetical protein